MYAPLIVFAYNRPEHLKKTLLSLGNNREAAESDLFIFIDGPKTKKDENKNTEVEQVAKKATSGKFRMVSIRNTGINKGLAQSVITGVQEVINKYGKVIVTEDDSVSSPFYLKFMNRALDIYQDNPRIWSVGGYTVPLNLPAGYTHDTILTQRSSSYAWATWEDRWNRIDWDVADYKRFRWDFRARHQFNQWGNDRASMLDDQMNGRVNSWAIRFDYSMFRNGMYNILPSQSLIQNIGHDGSGTHNQMNQSQRDHFAVKKVWLQENFTFDITQVNEDIRIEFIKSFYCSKKSLFKRFISNLIYM